MFKNVGSQKFIVFAFDATTNLPKTGDAANISCYIAKDYGAVAQTGDTTATEMDATNAKGYYLFDATQAETNADCILVTGKSSTANVVVVGAPACIFTDPPSYTSLAISGGAVTVGTNNDKTGYALTAAEEAAIADALLGRSIAGGANGGRMVKDALRILRNRFQASGTTLTVYQEDDTTAAWTSTLTLDGTAQPITQSDPA
jgi:hypothetical protein